MKSANLTDGPLAGLVNSSQATIHNLTDHVRSTADGPRRLLDSRRRNDRLRELGELYYDAQHTGTEPSQKSVDRLIALLDAEPRENTEHSEPDAGHR